MRYDDKPVLITGCSSGMGLHATKALVERGYPVFATARNDDDLAMLATIGATPLRLDYDDSDSIKAAVTEMTRITNGRVYALFNNAAYGQPGAVEDLSREALMAQFQTNFFGVVELTNQVVPIMRQQGEGRIIMNSSVLGMVALPFRGAYNASKFALEGITDTLRLELKGSGVHVSLIEPGPIVSRFREHSLAAFKRHIDFDSSIHKERYLSMEQRLVVEESKTPFTLGPEAVTKRVIHALESRRPQVRYYVTVPTYIFGVLRRILPYRLLDMLLTRSG